MPEVVEGKWVFVFEAVAVVEKCDVSQTFLVL